MTRAADRGTISLLTVIFTAAVFLLAGLLFDGGLAIHARERAYDIAEQAARAGANDIDQDTLRATGKAEISPDAIKAVNAFMAASYTERDMDFGCDPPQPQEMTCHVTIRVRSNFLGVLPGLASFTMTGTASAHPDEGNP
jgi:Flp pilus assembly protein TadG